MSRSVLGLVFNPEEPLFEIQEDGVTKSRVPVPHSVKARVVNRRESRAVKPYSRIGPAPRRSNYAVDLSDCVAELADAETLNDYLSTYLGASVYRTARHPADRQQQYRKIPCYLCGQLLADPIRHMLWTDTHGAFQWYFDLLEEGHPTHANNNNKLEGRPLVFPIHVALARGFDDIQVWLDPLVQKEAMYFNMKYPSVLSRASKTYSEYQHPLLVAELKTWLKVKTKPFRQVRNVDGEEVVWYMRKDSAARSRKIRGESE